VSVQIDTVVAPAGQTLLATQCNITRACCGVAQGNTGEVLQRVCGQAVAIDISLWIFQAATQPTIAGIFSPYARILKVIFERVRHSPKWGNLVQW